MTMQAGLTVSEFVDFLYLLNLSSEELEEKGGLEPLMAEKKVVNVVLDEPGNIVVTDQKHVDGHVLAVADQLILAPRIGQTTAGQQLHRMLGQAPRLLYCDLDTGI